jgi:hypothetical protein
VAILIPTSIVVALAACYSPDLRDCTVTCESTADCAAGQICGEDGFCAVRDVAGGCVIAERDAGVIDPDTATPNDTTTPNDTNDLGLLQLTITGHGTVHVFGVGSCDWKVDPCTYELPLDDVVTLLAIPAEDYALERWSSACAGSIATCTLAIAPHQIAGAEFRRIHDDD